VAQVFKDAAVTAGFQGSVHQTTQPSTPSQPSVCPSLRELKDVNFKFFTMDTLKDMDWSGVIVAGGAVETLTPKP
jgi:hypothetical protein